MLFADGGGAYGGVADLLAPGRHPRQGRSDAGPARSRATPPARRCSETHGSRRPRSASPPRWPASSPSAAAYGDSSSSADEPRRPVLATQADPAARARRRSCSSPSSTGSRPIPTCTRSSTLDIRQAEVQALRAEKTQLQKRLAQAGTTRAARARGAAARARQAGRAAVHRQGHPRLAQASLAHRARPTARSSSASSAVRRARFARVAVRCPFGRPAVTEQAALRRERPAVPDPVLRHVPRARGGDLAARGGGRRRALDAGRRRATSSSRRASRRPRPSSADPARARRRHRRRDAGRQPEVPARARRVRARAAGLRARRPHPRRAARALARVLLYSVTMDVELARQQWEDGVRRIEATAGDRRPPPPAGPGRRRRRRAAAAGRPGLHARGARGRVRRRRRVGPIAPRRRRPRRAARAGAGHGRGRRVPPLRTRRDGLPAVKRVAARGGGPRARLRGRRCARRGARRQPGARAARRRSSGR